MSQPHPLESVFAEHLPRWLQRPAVARFFGIPATVGMLRSLGAQPSYGAALRGLGASVAGEGLQHVPTTGPLVVVANHPFSMIDVLSVGTAVEQRRAPGSVRAVVDRASAALVELHPLMCFVGDDAAGREAFWRDALGHLEGGGAVVMFPAGHSVKRDRHGVALETPWRGGALKLVARSGACLVPAHVHAPSRRRYQFLRRRLDRQVVQKLNLREAARFRDSARVRFGAPLRGEGLTPDGLRDRVYQLGGEPFKRAEGSRSAPR